MATEPDEQRIALVTALRESQEAERVWRVAVAEDARSGVAPNRASRRRIDLLWKERERARLRLDQLRWVDPVRGRKAPKTVVLPESQRQA